MQFKGKVKNITPIQKGVTKNGDDWGKIQIVVEEQKDEYPQVFVGDLFKKGENIKYIDDSINFAVGDVVSIEYNLSGSEYQGRWFGNNSIWKVEKASSQSTPPPPTPPTSSNNDDSDDLPF